LTMSTNGSSVEPYRDHLGGRMLCAPMSSSSSAESSRTGLSSKSEQVEATNPASCSIVMMPSEKVFDASSLIEYSSKWLYRRGLVKLILRIDSSLNRIEAMLRNLCKSPSNGSKVIETTVPCDKRDVLQAMSRSHKTRSEPPKATSLPGCVKTCKERISQDAAKHDKSSKDKDETAKVCGGMIPWMKPFIQ
uniref:PI3K/PI4K domain-containing protein n=1 Tax=Toxocara canis TaxID=6265 RepID=A0A183VGL3_TOXCA